MSVSPSMVEELLSQLQGAPMQQMAQSLGESPQQTQQAVQAAIPMLLGALGNNTQNAGGAEALFGALQRDHAGGPDLGGLLGSLLGGGKSSGARGRSQKVCACPAAGERIAAAKTSAREKVICIAVTMRLRPPS